MFAFVDSPWFPAACNMIAASSIFGSCYLILRTHVRNRGIHDQNMNLMRNIDQLIKVTQEVKELLIAAETSDNVGEERSMH